MPLRSALINVMVKAAMKAARGLKRDFGEIENLQVSKKGPADFVTNADERTEGILFDELSRARPDYGFLMEERGTVEGRYPDSPRWIIDPVDGTLNFMHGLPHFAISVAAEERGEIIAGLVYEPIHDELFWAERGRGAYLNDGRLRVASRQNLDAALLATGIPFHGRPGHEVWLAEGAAFMQQVAGIRRFGSAALDLAYVAAGRFDGFWERGLNAWDIAAGVLLVKEAGGYVSEPNGRAKMLTSGDLVAGNEAIHKAMCAVLKDVAA